MNPALSKPFAAGFVVMVDTMLVSEYSKDDEDEADWLAGALLLPRQALVEHRRRGLSVEQIARHHAVSRQMCEWRVRMTGVDLQLRRAKASG